MAGSLSSNNDRIVKPNTPSVPPTGFNDLPFDAKAPTIAANALRPFDTCPDTLSRSVVSAITDSALSRVTTPPNT